MIKKKKRLSGKVLWNYFKTAIVFFILGYIFFKIMNVIRMRSALDTDPKNVIKALVVDEKEYNPNQPVSPAFSYKYRFEVNGKEYIGVSHNEKLQPGDSLEIEYVINNPNFNAPKGYYK